MSQPAESGPSASFPAPTDTPADGVDRSPSDGATRAAPGRATRSTVLPAARRPQPPPLPAPGRPALTPVNPGRPALTPVNPGRPALTPVNPGRPVPAPDSPGERERERARVQHRTLRLLFGTQIVAGTGYTIGVTLGALLAQRLGGTGVSGFASSSAVVGGALLAVPVTRLMRARGRRAGLVLAYLVGATGAVVVVLAAQLRWTPLLFAGMMLFGGGTTANLQARYTAVDLATPARRGRQLSLIVWATTIGAVVAPNLASGVDGYAHRLGLPLLAGPFAFSALALAATAIAITIFLRPDPLLTARRLARTPDDHAGLAGAIPVGAHPNAVGRTGRDGAGMREAWRVIIQLPTARLGVAAVAVGHLVMVAVMSMTPVHIGETHHGAGVLRIVGFVLSVHIAGMYALSPVVGWLTDRWGRRPVIFVGVGVLLAACAIAGTAGADTAQLTVGLGLLGLGWSCTMVAGSTLLTESVPEGVRPAAQGLSDMLMGLAGAAGGAVSGLIVDTSGYPTLTMLAALATVPLVALLLRAVPPASTVEG